MTGPVAGLPDLPTVSMGADSGDIENGDVVWVIDIGQFVRVYKPAGADAVILRHFYPAESDLEDDEDDGYVPPWTPGIIDPTGSNTVVVNDECAGGILPLRQSFGKIAARSTGVLYHVGAAAADTDIDTADLVTASDTSDLP